MLIRTLYEALNGAYLVESFIFTGSRKIGNRETKI